MQNDDSSISTIPAKCICCTSVRKNYVPSRRTFWSSSDTALTGKVRKVWNSLPFWLSLLRNEVSSIFSLPVVMGKMFCFDMCCLGLSLSDTMDVLALYYHCKKQTTSNMGASNNRNVSSHRSAGQKSGWGLARLRSKCWPSFVPSGGSRGARISLCLWAPRSHPYSSVCDPLVPPKLANGRHSFSCCLTWTLTRLASLQWFWAQLGNSG